ncbi:hypothetical protein ACLOJK_025226 [Asimina triloba]
MPLRNRKAGAASRRDRHSKILTRQGPRDRRMRLSLEVARKFFHLQDMLGFDKASKTVAWLLSNSKAAIKEAEAEARGEARSSSPSMYSDSDHCQVMVLPTGGEGEGEGEGGGGGGGGVEQKKMKKKRAVGRKAAKEWRAMARAKARERTEEKIRSRRMESSSSTPHDKAAAAVYFNDYDDHIHDDSSSLKEQQQLLQLEAEPIISHPFAHQASMVHDDDHDHESIGASAAAAAGQVSMINSIFDYHLQQQHLSPGVNSANPLGSFQNSDMTINFFPDNWGEMGGPNHTHTPLTTALLFKPSAHHVQFCPKTWNNTYNNQTL